VNDRTQWIRTVGTSLKNGDDYTLFKRERVPTAYRIHRITDLNMHEFVYPYRAVHNNDYTLNVNDDR